MKKLKHGDLINSKQSLRESRKDHVNKLDFINRNFQSTSNLSRQISRSNSNRRTKCAHRESSISSKNMYKLDQSYLKSSLKKNIDSSSLTDNIFTVNIRQQNLSKSFDYSRRIILPFSESLTDNNYEFIDSTESSIRSNGCSVENSWSNLWRSGLPEQKLTVWLPRRYTEQDYEHLQCRLNKASSSIKLHKISFPDVNFLELDSSLTLKTIQKLSPQVNSTSNSYWALNTHCTGHNTITANNNNNKSSTNGSRLSNNLHKIEVVHLMHPDNSNKLTIMGNSYPVNRPPDIKEKTLAQLSLIRKEDNCTTSIDSGTNVKGYMDPMVGAPIEYLNRINELSKLQAITKRWERTRCRRRVKKDMVINKSVVDPIR
ncbi:unnamed protein product [Schistosoma rodhaini]|uniref:AbLIM_anchor domain-containing protein n=1 Tax=Schistosoma mansoni TaxID=6183 RepID=A0A3Q0KM46_SCHMA|nr:unnamed protein product [Schistosoma rodhaini]